MMTNSIILAQVDDFIKRWNNGELVLTDQAKDLEITFSIGEKHFWGSPKILKKRLPDYVGWAIARYQYERELGLSRVFLDTAYELLDTIQRARAYRAIVDTKQQITDYEKQIENLKEQNSSLRDLNTKLAMENKRLRNLLPADTRMGDTEVGDVEK
jgi:cysteinyl-tRNA synthetase